jgi:hypothetical protein
MFLNLAKKKYDYDNGIKYIKYTYFLEVRKKENVEHDIMEETK